MSFPCPRYVPNLPGCGEFPDLARAGDLASEWGLDLIQLLPVNDSGFQTSPYFALSAFALHPLYLRIGDLPELAAGTEKAGGDGAVGLRSEAESLVGRFSGEARVPHEAVLAAKLELLRKVWSFASEGRAGRPRPPLGTRSLDRGESLVQRLRRLRRAEGEERAKPWWEWPRLHNPTPADIDSLWGDKTIVEELRFWAWVQMRSAEQFRPPPSTWQGRASPSWATSPY